MDINAVFLEERGIKCEPPYYDDTSESTYEPSIDAPPPIDNKVGRIFLVDANALALCCIFCSYRSDSLTEFHLHVQQHLMVVHPSTDAISSMDNDPGPKRYYCSICGRDYSDKSNMARHKRKAHPGGAAAVIEPEISIEAPDVSDMWPQQNEETLNASMTNGYVKGKFIVDPDTMKYVCEFCSQRYTDKSNLRRHQRSAHGRIARQRGKAEKESEEQGVESLSHPAIDMKHDNPFQSELSSVNGMLDRVAPSVQNPIPNHIPPIKTEAPNSASFHQSSNEQQHLPSVDRQFDGQMEEMSPLLLAQALLGEEAAPMDASHHRPEHCSPAQAYTSNAPLANGLVKGKFIVDPETNKFVCEFCPQSYTDKSNLRRHQRSVHERIPRFRAKNKAKVQKQIIESSPPPTAKAEAEANTDPSRVEIPSLISENSLSQRSGISDQATSTPENLPSQRMSYPNRTNAGPIIGRGKIFCPICRRGFNDKSNMRRHKLKVHQNGSIGPRWDYSEGEDMRFKCDLCDRRYTDISNLYRHRRTVHKITRMPTVNLTFPHNCRHCGESIPTAREYRRHTLTHDFDCTRLDADKFQCNLCQKIFESFGTIQKHRIIHEERKYFCDYCQRGYPMLSLLRKHMEIHSPDLKYICQYCGKRFNSSKNMRMHTRGHEEPNFRQKTVKNPKVACNICGEIRAQKYIRKHMLRHTETKAYACTQCDKRFYDRNTLNMHSVSHEDVRRFQCNHCPNTYKLKHALRLHMRTHTGEYIYGCEMCGKGFAEKRSMMRHVELKRCMSTSDAKVQVSPAT